MGNKLYINFSAESSKSDSWATELRSSLKLMLGRISETEIQFLNGLENSNPAEVKVSEADLIILVFNGFASDEFAADLKTLELTHQNLVDNGKEIFIVIKSPKFSPVIPVYLRKYAQYNFFEVNIRTNEAIEYAPLQKGEKENKFWSKLTDLAYDSRLYFDNLNGNLSAAKVNVYLAEVSKDQINHREILKREFQLSGYNVLPIKPLPGSLKEYRDAASEIIRTADFSIHIMGEIYGDTPSGSDYSFVEIQNKLVTELLSQEPVLRNNFYRFVWLPPSLEPYDEKQIQYLKRLKRELNDNRSGEIIQCSIEEFKEIIAHKVNSLQNIETTLDFKPVGKKVILIIDKPDESSYQKVVTKIKDAQKEYELIDMTRTGDLLPLAMFRQALNASDAAIIMNLSDRNNWLDAMLGLTLKNISIDKNNKNKLVAALTKHSTKDDIDFDALHVDNISLDDSQFSEKIEKFLTQIK